MKQLNNNFTTPEQSKKLLELGVPADTADCYYEAIGFNNGYESVPQICSNVNFGINVIDLPCWSVGRLIEIMLNSQIDTGTYALGFMLDKDTFSIESLIDIIDEDIKEFDFSKLED